MQERNTLGIHGAIGKVLENRIQQALPHLVKNPDGSNMPDFSFVKGDVHLEAKNGYKSWGPKPHSFQFSNLVVKPDFYALGFHDFENSLELTKKGTYFDWLDQLEKEMNFDKIIFCSSEVVESIFHLMVPNEQKEVHNYGRIRPSFINGIFNDGTFKIQGIEYSGLDLAGENYHVVEPRPISSFDCDVGFIVRNQDIEKLEKLFRF